MKIVWDEPKRLSNIEKHGFDFADLTEAFFEEAMVVASRTPRYKAINWFGGEVVAVIFQPLGTEAVSVISMRIANQKERNL